MRVLATYTIYSLGDSVITIDFGNIIDEHVNKQVHQLFNEFRKEPLPAMIDLVPAYSSLSIYYDCCSPELKVDGSTAYASFRKKIEERLGFFSGLSSEDATLIKIPVCYDPAYGVDLQTMAVAKGMTTDEIVQCHTSMNYRVYMIGFLPGFPYMGTLDKKISMPRKEKPRSVRSGSVGIAGIQTGIYPVDSPGGWQIIGRTPMILFDKEKAQPALLKPGDKVKFHSITKDEFENYTGRDS